MDRRVVSGNPIENACAPLLLTGQMFFDILAPQFPPSDHRSVVIRQKIGTGHQFEANCLISRRGTADFSGPGGRGAVTQEFEGQAFTTLLRLGGAWERRRVRTY